jgi:putative signal transducing protein
MIELFRSNDPIELSWAQSVLADEGISSHIFDYHASIIEGSIGALQRRLMVDGEQESRAKYILDIARRELDAHNAEQDKKDELTSE